MLSGSVLCATRLLFYDYYFIAVSYRSYRTHLEAVAFTVLQGKAVIIIIIIMITMIPMTMM